MHVQLAHSKLNSHTTIGISASKSEANRWLILQALFPQITLENSSPADDVQVLQRALQIKNGGIIDVHHAGTAMRFLTAYLALHTNQVWTLTGSERMHKRPIGALVDTLVNAGAKISYLGEEGYPPLRIEGQKSNAAFFSIDASQSSQYVSALLLAAAGMPQPTKIDLGQRVASKPYIEMTLQTIASLGGSYTWHANSIELTPIANLQSQNRTIESDWSSASYWYSWVALSPIGTKIQLTHYLQDSWQGDAQVQVIYQLLGVETAFIGSTVELTKVEANLPKCLMLDLHSNPDLAQTIAVTAAGLGIGCDLTGLHTLRIKETDRLMALQSELKKVGVEVKISDSTLVFEPVADLIPNAIISTFDDHRMALAFAPLALRVPLEIAEAEVVSKSYVGYWEDLEKAGIALKKRFD